MAYVLHLDFADFVRHADEVGNEPVYVQDFHTTESFGGVPNALLVQIICTYKDIGENIHACRIVVERASLLADDRQAICAAVQRRVNAAAALVTAALPGETRRGMLLEAGMYDDLNKIQTDHDLWTWRGDQRDPLARELVPNP